MRTRLGKTFSWLCLLLVCACKNPKYREDTRLFNNYLKTYIQTEIPDDTMYYVVIAEHGCEGCIGKTVTKLKNNRKALFIVNENSFRKYIEPKDVPADKYRIDTTDMIRRLKFHQHNLGIVQTANKEIYNIVYVLYNGADSVLKHVN